MKLSLLLAIPFLLLLGFFPQEHFTVYYGAEFWQMETRSKVWNYILW